MKSIHVLAAALALCACKPKPAVEPVAAEPIAPAAAPASPVAPAITADGWGAIKMEMTNKEAVAALGVLQPDTMEHDEDWLACHVLRPKSPDGVYVMVEEDRVSRVSAHAAGVLSDKGIAVGDPEVKVRAAYSTGLKDEPHKYEDKPAKYLTWWATPGGHGVRYTINSKGLVDEISGGTGSIELVEGCS